MRNINILGSSRSQQARIVAYWIVTSHPKVHFLPVQGATHFTVIRPISRLIARKILRDDAPDPNIKFDEEELAAAMKR